MNCKIILLFICLNLVLINCSFLDKIGNKINSTLTKWEDGVKKAGEKVKNWEDNVDKKIGQTKDKVKDKVKGWLGHLHENDQKPAENVTALPDEERRTVKLSDDSKKVNYKSFQLIA